MSAEGTVWAAKQTGIAVSHHRRRIRADHWYSSRPLNGLYKNGQDDSVIEPQKYYLILMLRTLNVRPVARSNAAIALPSADSERRSWLRAVIMSLWRC